jgi:hypothetical protein
MPYIPTTLDTDVTCEGEWIFLTYADIRKEQGTRIAEEAIDGEEEDGKKGSGCECHAFFGYLLLLI